MVSAAGGKQRDGDGPVISMLAFSETVNTVVSAAATTTGTYGTVSTEVYAMTDEPGITEGHAREILARAGVAAADPETYEARRITGGWSFGWRKNAGTPLLGTVGWVVADNGKWRSQALGTTAEDVAQALLENRPLTRPWATIRDSRHQPARTGTTQNPTDVNPPETSTPAGQTRSKQIPEPRTAEQS